MRDFFRKWNDIIRFILGILALMGILIGLIKGFSFLHSEFIVLQEKYTQIDKNMADISTSLNNQLIDFHKYIRKEDETDSQITDKISEYDTRLQSIKYQTQINASNIKSVSKSASASLGSLVQREDAENRENKRLMLQNEWQKQMVYNNLWKAIKRSK